MVFEKIGACHCCFFNVKKVCPCPSCGKNTCEDCFAPQRPTTTGPAINCDDCEKAYQELKGLEEWLSDFTTDNLKALGECVTRNSRFLNFDPLEENCCRIASYVATTVSSSTKPFPIQVTIALNFMGNPYFKIRLTNYPDVDPWEEENREL